jgi:HAD superfamily hydrolase (TIGR01484 family)
MKTISELPAETRASIEILFTDIDDTITTEGKLPSESYQSLWSLHRKGIQVIPVTGRPAGWCEMIARFWPVGGVIGENGAFYFRHTENKMTRWFAKPEIDRNHDQKKLEIIKSEILSKVKGSAISSDQFCRLYDLAVDFCEDVPALDKNAVHEIVRIFESHGAHAKISSIHVNGWFGDFNKLSTTKIFLKNVYNLEFDEVQGKIGFIGDSPNDEPMFQAFKNSFGVGNIRNFEDQLKYKPQFVADFNGGQGFSQISDLFSN